MLFIPWVYTSLEEKRTSPPQFAVKARQVEMSLVDPLLANSDHAGVFGRVASNSLKRLPSSVYWYGLGAWGIRRISCSQDEYHRHVDEVYIRRDVSRQRFENDDYPDIETQTWHPRLPKLPDGFPDEIEQISFNLEPDEASFLLDLLVEYQKDSFLTHLALKCQPVYCDFPWQHPELSNVTSEHRDLVRYAEFFSTLMHGAAFLYNLMLAKYAGLKTLEDEHRGNLDEWRGRLQHFSWDKLPLHSLWELTTGRGHTITRGTKDFVSNWHERVRETDGDVADDSKSRSLISFRERRLKGVRSRFTNSRARDQWKGYAGVTQMTYRWSNITTLLSDLHAGLNESNNA